MRPALLRQILDTEFNSILEEHHTPVMLWGPPGLGKSQMVAQVGERHEVPAPLANRFSHFEVEVHLDDWVAWVRPRHR